MQALVKPAHEGWEYQRRGAKNAEMGIRLNGAFVSISRQTIMNCHSGRKMMVGAVLAVAVALSPQFSKCAEAPELGLEFLQPIPEFRGLSLKMSEEQLKAEIKKHGLYSKFEARPDSPDRTNAVSYWLLTLEGENVIVGFASARCTGIQRMQPIPKAAIKDEVGEAEYRKWMEERKSASRASDGDNWSEPVKGLRGRLHVLAPNRPGSPFCRVLLELENVDEILGQKHIRFSPGKIALRVTDESGKELAVSTGAYDGISPIWETIALPHGSSMKFDFSSSGVGYRPARTSSLWMSA
jgi:hypothetical protein